MRYRLPPLNSLRLFEAAARRLSFKHAAEELLLTPSAVSHGIQSLEDWLGVPLFRRTPRGLSLTEAGSDYYPVVRQALAALASGAERVSGRSAAAALAISAAPTFAARWLLPRLPKFRERHPQISVTVDTAQDHSELSTAGVDLAIRMGSGGWEGLVANRVLTEELVPVCTPDLYERLGNSGSFDEVPLIHVTTVSEDWSSWAAAAGMPRPDAARGLRFDTIQMAFDAACQGLGVAIGRKPLVDAELRDGRLVEACRPSVKSSTSYWLVGSPDRLGEPAIMAFRTWMAEQAADPALV